MLMALTKVNRGMSPGIDQAKSEVIDGSPTSLDTLEEISNAINNDPNFHSSIQPLNDALTAIANGEIRSDELPKRLGVYASFNSITDANLAIQTGWYMVPQDGINTPTDYWWIIRVESYMDVWITQTALYPFASNENDSQTFSYRRHYNGTDQVWGAWYPLEDRKNKLFVDSNIIGTVAQVDGVPTGAIIERGFNANGEYTKFADGTLICTADLPAQTWTYPAAFIDGPMITGTAVDATVGIICGFSTRTATSVELKTRDTNPPAVRVGHSCSWIAIGHWF